MSQLLGLLKSDGIPVFFCCQGAVRITSLLLIGGAVMDMQPGTTRPVRFAQRLSQEIGISLDIRRGTTQDIERGITIVLSGMSEA